MQSYCFSKEVLCIREIYKNVLSWKRNDDNACLCYNIINTVKYNCTFAYNTGLPSVYYINFLFRPSHHCNTVPQQTACMFTFPGVRIIPDGRNSLHVCSNNGEPISAVISRNRCKASQWEHDFFLTWTSAHGPQPTENTTDIIMVYLKKISHKPIYIHILSHVAMLTNPN